MQTGGGGWAARLGFRTPTPGAPSVDEQHERDRESTSSSEFVYGRVSADSDDESIDIHGTHPHKAQQKSASFGGPSSSSAQDAALAGSAAAQPAASGPLPPMISLLDDDGPPTTAAATAGSHATDETASARHAADQSLENFHPGASAAAESLHHVPASSSSGQDGGDLSFSGLASVSGVHLTEDQRRFGEQLAAEAEEDLKWLSQEGQQPEARQEASSSRGAFRPPGGGAEADAEPTGTISRDMGSCSAVQQQGEAAGEVEEGDSSSYAHERRELLIFALPISRDKVVFLPVVPWRHEPEPERRPQGQASGLSGFIRGRIAQAVDEASDLWAGMQAADEGTLKHRIFKLGQRMLDGISAEERLMRALPKKVSRVLIFHPSHVTADSLMSQMQTMTQSYGIKAVGKAAAATLMLPLALGVDLIILPGPQVLTYYTAWQLWRNAAGVVGTQRAAFVTQTTGNADIRVNYIPDTRLDHAYEAVMNSPDGVMPDEEIDTLVSALKEPSLEQPLRELRRQRLRKGLKGARDGRAKYAALPGHDLVGEGAAAAGGRGGHGGQGADGSLPPEDRG